MPKTRNHVRLATSLRELAELGSSVDLSVADTEDRPADIEIEQVGGIHESTVMELSNGLTGYLLDSDITNQTSSTIYCGVLSLRLPWEDSWFEWILDPREVDKSESYRFPGKNSLELPRDEVINHVLLARKGLKPKCPLRGRLLATGGPMPKSLRHGQWIDATLAIITSDHIEHSAIFRLWTQRLEARPKRATREYDLFGEPVGHDIGSLVAARTEPGPAHGPEIGKSVRRPGRRTSNLGCWSNTP